ncbi:hypothetical protein B0H17DRAFT_1176763 [Mycena rosella]|uniref:F-box domain-containing protein n=1 Tax=Mycena rosella TaxID=1033263 RepID=A0AAD7GLI2_MYCRO|nr:hypothetical protein B0H17DRAFT_1176763 [Mycena rosella]
MTSRTGSKTGSEASATGPIQATQAARERAAYRSRITAIENHILELQHTLGALEQEKDLLKDRLDAYTYPVLAVPNEIVSEIFIHFLPIYPRRAPLIGPHSPSLLGQICRKWRDIALSTPALWRAVTLSLDTTHLEQQLQRLKFFLKRSGSCRLSIELVFKNTARGAASQELSSPFIQAITAHCAPLLSRVHIYFYCDSHLALPWSQLTVLTVELITDRQLVDVLSRAVNLIFLRFGFYGGDAAQQPRKDTTLPCLETLVVVYPGTAVSRQWLDALTLPALRRFQVPEIVILPNSIAALVSLVSRSQCNLQELSVTHSRSAIPTQLYRTALPSVASFIRNGGLNLDWEERAEWY